ncbi:MAG: symporter, partial [Ignavibacterium sp.]
SVGLILIMNLKEQAEKNTYVLNLNTLLVENVSEFISGIVSIRQNKKMNSSIVMSVVILVIIIGLWSLWN